MLKKTIIILLSFCFVGFAQDAGKTGLSFLKIGPSGRNIAVSDIGILDGDLSSVFYNPAIVNLKNSSSIFFTHQAWIQDMTSEVFYGNIELFGLPLAVGVNTTKISGFEARVAPTETPDAKFNVNYFYGSLSSGFSLIDKLQFGFSIKYLYESILADDASGTGYDLGLIYEDMMENLNIGLSVRNLGSMQSLRKDKSKLPSDLILSATYLFELKESNLEFIPILGYQKYLDLSDSHFHAGAEVTYDELISIRLGYVTGFEAKGLSAGAGINWHGFNFDYAFTPFSYGIGNANTITLMYNF